MSPLLLILLLIWLLVVIYGTYRERGRAPLPLMFLIGVVVFVIGWLIIQFLVGIAHLPA